MSDFETARLGIGCENCVKTADALSALRRIEAENEELRAQRDALQRQLDHRIATRPRVSRRDLNTRNKELQADNEELRRSNAVLKGALEAADEQYKRLQAELDRHSNNNCIRELEQAVSEAEERANELGREVERLRDAEADAEAMRQLKDTWKRRFEEEKEAFAAEHAEVKRLRAVEEAAKPFATEQFPGYSAWIALRQVLEGSSDE